jgi:hypothetical protein
MQAGIVAGGAVVLALVAHTIVNARDLAQGKHSLVAKVAAVRETLGVQWFALRDPIERETLRSASADYAGDDVEPEARTGAFRSQPGLYLRTPLADVRDRDSIVRAAAGGQKDAFVGCLLREPNERGLRGEIDGGAFAEQPWNLGQAYVATQIFSADWEAAVRAVDEPMRLRVFEEQYEHAMRDDIPLSVDIVTRAKFFLLVLDETGIEPVARSDAGTVSEEDLQLTVHPARIHLFDVKTGKEILRLRRSGEGHAVQVGERAITDPETVEAMRRQANNCALARLVEDALHLP